MGNVPLSGKGLTMTAEIPHISVCICTYRRPELLRRLLEELVQQKTDGRFTYSVVVADNDREETARPVVGDVVHRAEMDVTYCVEPRRNIALVRNAAVARAKGDFIAFIDDDEYPTPVWLHELFATIAATGADGVVGPVVPYFVTKPPRWATRGRFFEKPTRTTGCGISDAEMRTSNVLFRRTLFEGMSEPFRAEFGTGNEDSDFFRRMRDRGCCFVSCAEAVVYEQVPPARCTRRYLARRALHRGNNLLKGGEGHGCGVLKSLMAIPAYMLALPFVYLAGEHHFVKVLMKLCDHTGKMLAVFRIQPFQEYK